MESPAREMDDVEAMRDEPSVDVTEGNDDVDPRSSICGIVFGIVVVGMLREKEYQLMGDILYRDYNFETTIYLSLHTSETSLSTFTVPNV